MQLSQWHFDEERTKGKVEEIPNDISVIIIAVWKLCSHVDKNFKGTTINFLSQIL